MMEKCLLPLQLALESKNVKLAQHALAGMQKLLSDDRFVTMETDSDDKQLLNQMLNAVRVTPSLNEDLQVEVMKVLLCITFTPTFELNGSSILKIAEVCIETYVSSYHQRSINTAVRATLSQMLSDLTLQLRQRQENTIIENQGVLQGFKSPDSTTESLCDDVVSVFTVLCEKLQTVISENQQLQLLYLECILSMLTSSSASMCHHKGFTDLIWKQLCPALIVILGNPVHDKTITSAHSSSSHEADTHSSGVSDHGRGSGCSSTAPALSSPVARTIYYIAAELVRLVGSVESMKPVLQSLYHRMLLYPPPQHRVEAIKIMKEAVSKERLRVFTAAQRFLYEGVIKSVYNNVIIKKSSILDGMTEACIKGGIEACYASVSCVCALLGTLDELSQGKGLEEEQVHLLIRRLDELKDGTETSRDSLEINDADFRWQRRILSSEQTPWDAGNEKSPDISISVTTDTGQTTLEGDLGQTTPEDHSNIHKNSLQSLAGHTGREIHYKDPESEAIDQPDVVQRSHTMVYPDITNFLSVDCRARSCGSRYSESNFSIDDQDLSRTEFDSCDQYSMAAEKDSGRSDVSDIGSDNCSLADEEQTPRDCPGHKSLRTAALSLKLLKNQEADQHSARLFIQSLESLLPRLIALPKVEDVDLALQNFASTFCSGMMHSPGFDGNASFTFQTLMNADSLYMVSHYILLLNLKLSNSDYYRKKPAQSPVLMKEFMKQVQSSGVLMVFSQAWVEELYHQVLERNLLGEAGYWGSPEEHSLPLITMLTDIDGLGSSSIGGQLMASASTQSPLTQNWKPDDALVAGVAFARYLLIGCWKNLIDTLSTPLTGRMAGSSKGLAFILGAEGVKEQNQKEKDAICMSLDGLRKAARLSCVLGVAANCASALAQMAAASCVQEEKEEKEIQEPSDAIAQVKQKVEQKLEQMGKVQGVCLHTAHVLCMDAILNVGLEMGSHNQDCWPHVFRVCEYISTLEHAHFSDGTSQAPVTITQAQQAPGTPQGDGQPTDPSQELTEEEETALRNTPVIQPVSIQELIKEGSKGRAFDFRGGSLMSGSSAAKAILTLSTQADRLFEDAVDKLNLMALGGEVKSTQDRKSALHLFRLGGAMLRIAACHKERHVSRKAVSFIHDILTEVLTDWNEQPHFHFNEALFRPFERIMQLELCDEDVQDQARELVEVCSTRIQSGWRPLFSALETVHSSSKSEVKEYLVGDYSMGKCQAPVFDVFEAFLNTDNIQVFANAATSYIMCLMKFVKGLGEADCKEIGDCVPGSGSMSTDLCLPALDYLRRCSQLLAKIYKMPLKPIFLSGKLANLPQRIQERSAGSEDGIECVLSEFDDDTGLINVWIILLEELTTAISNCPRQHQPPTLDLLFELLRDVTKTPDIGYENMINTMLKDLFKLLVACVAEPTESISRVGCSCIRYVLVTAGPNLLGYFHSGSENFSGDACEVKVAAPSLSPSAEAEYWRIRAMAQQNLYDILLEEFVKGPSHSEEKMVQQPAETKLAGFLRYISMQNLAVIFDLLLDSYRTAREFDTRTGLKCLLKKVSGIGGAANLYRQSAMSFNIYFHALICAIVTNQENITAEQVKKILFEEDERSTDSSQQCSSEDEDIFEETAQVSPPRGKEKRQWRARLPSLSVQPVSNADWAWLIKRLHKLCMELCNNYIQMHLDLENSTDELPVFRGDTFFILPSFQSETSTPSTGGLSGKDTPSEDDKSQMRDSLTETVTPKGGSGDMLLIPPMSPKTEKKDQGRKKEWWESAGNKIYTIATDKTITKLMTEYKKRKQQHNLATFTKADKKGDPLSSRGPDSPLPQRPQNLVDQGQMRHSFSAGPEILRQEKRPRSGSTVSSLSISIRDGEAQIQAWTNMVLTVLNQIQSLPDQIFTALQPAVFPCISQLTCHVTDIRVRQAVREWLGRVGRVYDIIV
ncbi:hypothetical protein JD844_024553 [Phrynosoma platyrhinos]|uniref:SEC7 domain-containing protein n=1 Tax=Phrynosoma platyrhinos TaxID=52577 RepID=A0ABQ7SYK2_PHRPL|nr:hypothetical protein JD844_024553 [Phrynosoma platyrhinos]